MAEINLKTGSLKSGDIGQNGLDGLQTLPNIVGQGEDIYTLTELVNSDFRMSTKDKDFELSHEMLIKACKILLYRFNLHQKKNSFER